MVIVVVVVVVVEVAAAVAIVVIVVVVVVVVVEEVIIVRFDAQYHYDRCYSSSRIWLDTWYQYVGPLKHPQCTNRNITRFFCLLGKWGVKITHIARNDQWSV